MNYERLTAIGSNRKPFVPNKDYRVDKIITGYDDGFFDILYRLAELEDKIENGELLTKEEHLKRCGEHYAQGRFDERMEVAQQTADGTLVELNDIAKLIAMLFDEPCNYDFDEESVSVYMIEHCADFCDHHCGNIDTVECWKRYLQTKLAELKKEK